MDDAEKPLQTLDAIGPPDGDRVFCRASAVEVAGAGALITGASGSGKSSLALTLMGFGARLISDDGVWIAYDTGRPVLCRPDTAPAMIEARGVGLLRVIPVPQARLRLVIDLDQDEPDRLPPWREIDCAGHRVPLILGANNVHLAPAVFQYLIHGRAE